MYVYYFEVGLTVSNVIQHYSTSFYSKYMNSFVRNNFGVHMLTLVTIFKPLTLFLTTQKKNIPYLKLN
jgi:hypothetical protein